MSVLSYLQCCAKDALLGNEKASIDKSIDTLKARLDSYFGNELETHFQFGSSTRGTILPRSMDDESDIDYMIVFKDGDSVPQTYLNRLKRFAEEYYTSSQIYQSSPTIVLELNHIKFDLVPARVAVWNAYKIPDGAGGWMGTNPNDFDSTLKEKNKGHANLIKPTIRLAKYWNAVNDYVYDSFTFEKRIVDLWFWNCANQKDYFFHVIDKLAIESGAAQWKIDKISRAKDIVAQVKELEGLGDLAEAEVVIKKLLPE